MYKHRGLKATVFSVLVRLGTRVSLFGSNSENWEYLNYTASVIPSVRPSACLSDLVLQPTEQFFPQFYSLKFEFLQFTSSKYAQLPSTG